MSQRESQSPHASSKIMEISDPEPGSANQDPRGKPASQEEPVTTRDIVSIDESIFETDEDIEQNRRAQDILKQGFQEDEEYLANGTNGVHKSRTIEITLQADSEFFHLLSAELSSIDNVQGQQKDRLTSQVSDLGQNIVAVTRPSGRGVSDLYAWREIISLYRDASVFFASTERDHGAHTAEQARERMEWFLKQIDKSQVVCSLRTFADQLASQVQGQREQESSH
jgi:hypothetical protein